MTIFPAQEFCLGPTPTRVTRSSPAVKIDFTKWVITILPSTLLWSMSRRIQASGSQEPTFCQTFLKATWETCTFLRRKSIGGQLPKARSMSSTPKPCSLSIELWFRPIKSAALCSSRVSWRCRNLDHTAIKLLRSMSRRRKCRRKNSFQLMFKWLMRLDPLLRHKRSSISQSW